MRDSELGGGNILDSFVTQCVEPEMILCIKYSYIVDVELIASYDQQIH
jgi:hypothetical protein